MKGNWLWLLAVVACADHQTAAVSDTLAAVSAGTAAPKFEAYAVASTYTGKIAPVNLASAAEARRFRTVLRDGAAGPPDFAGRYRVVEWGCGSPCHTFAIVESANGRVFMPGIAAMAGIAYRPDSRLLVVEPPEDVSDLCEEAWMRPICHDVYSYYYEWTGSRLALVDSIVVPATARRTATRELPNER
jgi:hypothetical protein